MTPQETGSIMMQLFVLFPKMRNETGAVLAWHSVIGHLDYGVAQTAARNYAQQSKFPPTPAELLEQADIAEGGPPSVDMAVNWFAAGKWQRDPFVARAAREVNLDPKVVPDAVHQFRRVYSVWRDEEVKRRQMSDAVVAVQAAFPGAEAVDESRPYGARFEAPAVADPADCVHPFMVDDPKSDGWVKCGRCGVVPDPEAVPELIRRTRKNLERIKDRHAKGKS